MPDLDEWLDHFQQRVLQDAFTQAWPEYWLRRAEEFERARSTPFDRTGDPEAEAERDARLAETAQACRRHASLLVEWWEG